MSDKKDFEKERQVDDINNNETNEVNEGITNVENEEVTNTENNKIKEKKNNKNLIKTVLISTLVGVVCLGVGYTYGKDVGRTLPATSKNYSSNKVIATVGDVDITEEMLRQKVEPYFYVNSEQELSDEEITIYETSMIDYIITTEILYQEGKAEGVKISEEDVQTEYTTIMQNIEQQLGITEDEILNKMKIPKEDIVISLEKELIARDYIGEASKVSEQEVTDYYSANRDKFLNIRASHILIQTVNEEGKALGEEEKKEKEKQAQEILDKIKSGEDFAKLAKEYSEDLSASNGGDLDFFGVGKMLPEFEEAAFSLETGEVTDELVETKFGYHIIKKTDEKYSELKDIKAELEYTLSYEKQSKIVDELMEKYNVQVND